jgi:hypothetical protein
LGLANHARPKVYGLPNPRHVGMTNMSDLTNNKQRGQLCTLIVMREKRKKKCKQSIISSNQTIIYLHAQHHVKEGTVAHPVRRLMARFGHQKTSHMPL